MGAICYIAIADAHTLKSSDPDHLQPGPDGPWCPLSLRHSSTTLKCPKMDTEIASYCQGLMGGPIPADTALLANLSQTRTLGNLWATFPLKRASGSRCHRWLTWAFINEPSDKSASLILKYTGVIYGCYGGRQHLLWSA